MAKPGAVIVIRHHPVPLTVPTESERFLLGYRMQHGADFPEAGWLLAQVQADQPLVEVRTVPFCGCVLCVTAVQGTCALVAIAREGERPVEAQP